ncbi:MAG: glycosyltransferase family 9 protein [Thermosulfidibacteraceae bacterium]
MRYRYRGYAGPVWLAFMPNWVGDFIMAFASVDEFFGSFLLFGRASFYELIAGRYERSFYIEKSGKFVKDLFSIFRSKAYKSVLFPNSFSSALIMVLGGMKKVVGLPTDFRSWLLTDRVEVEDFSDLHQAEVYRRILEPIGFRYSGPIKTRVYLKDEDVYWALDFLKNIGFERGNTVLIHPGASKRERCWPVDRYRVIVERLLKRGYNVIILGSKMEEDLGKALAEGLKGVLDLTSYGLPLGKLAAIILNGGFLFIGNDSGPIHIASCGVERIVGIYGSSSPRKTGPVISEGTKFFPVTKNFKCSPCRERFFRDCESIKGYPPCIYEITVDDVWEVLNEAFI